MGSVNLLRHVAPLDPDTAGRTLRASIHQRLNVSEYVLGDHRATEGNKADFVRAVCHTRMRRNSRTGDYTEKRPL